MKVNCAMSNKSRQSLRRKEGSAPRFRDRASLLKAVGFAVGRRAWRCKRYKGLGEMNASNCGKTTLDPNCAARCCRFRVYDAVDADSLFSLA